MQHSISSRPQIHKNEAHFTNNIKHIKNYECRYIPYETKVFSLYQRRKDALNENKNKNENNDNNDNKNRQVSLDSEGDHFKDMFFYTVPMDIKQYHDKNKKVDTQNVILSFACETQAQYVKSDLDNSLSSLYILPSTIKEMSYRSSILKLPYVVLLNAQCDFDKIDKGNKGVKEDKGNKGDKGNEIDHTRFSLFYTSKYLEVSDDYP